MRSFCTAMQQAFCALVILPTMALCFSSRQPKRPFLSRHGYSDYWLQRHHHHLSPDALLVLQNNLSRRKTKATQEVSSTRLHAEPPVMSISANGATAEGNNSAKKRRRNMFHESNKPIVLLGRSSSRENAELLRLAESLQKNDDNFFVTPPRILVPESFAVSSGGSITTSNSENQVTIVPDETLLLQALPRGTESTTSFAFPDVIVLDSILFEEDRGDVILLDVARTLYRDAGLLSIYVNVEPGDEMARNDEDQAMKMKHEEFVFLPYSDYEVCIRNQGGSGSISDDDTTDFGWEHVEWELTRLLGRARLPAAIPGDSTTQQSVNTAHLTMGQHTFFLSLSFPDIRQVQPYAAAMCLDVDAMEYRTDLLAKRDSRFDILYGMQLLRSYCRPNAVRVPGLPLAGAVLEDVMPIVYTVRTKHQAGTYPDETPEDIAKMFQMLEWGLRGGVEVLDVESAWDYVATTNLLNLAEDRYASQILGSHHVVGEEVTTEDAVMLFEQCALNGRAHGAKVVLSVQSEKKDRMAYEAGLIAQELAREEGKPVIPHIALVLGDVGQFSRIINLPFTPVTHESLPTKAAPGQLTAAEIMTTRLMTQIFQSKKYAILGHKIAYSVSPQMHGSAFRATRLPHEYVWADVATVEEFIESNFFKSGDFGGCSVTIPHKQAIIPYMDVLSEAARRIGSVNTVIAKDEYIDDEKGFDRVLYGDNTDWKGIFNPLNRLLGGRVDTEHDYCLILGAGGTARAAAFVASKLGLNILYYNRTPEKATELSESFGGTVVTKLEQDGAGKNCLAQVMAAEDRIRVVISTLPAAANFVLPSWILENFSRLPIVFDVNYKPYQTALLEQATGKGCAVVRGSEMLWEQGVGQFELWTGRTAPYAVMKHVVLENCLETVME